MATNPEAPSSNLENSELSPIRDALDSLHRRVKEFVNSTTHSENKESNDSGITKAPYEKNGAIIFNYEKSGQKWEIVTRKQGDTYKVRVKKWVRLSNGQMGWQTQKNGDKETFDFTATDKSKFNAELGKALNRTIGTNRDRLPKTGGKVYDMLDKKDNNNQGEKNNNKKEKNNNNFDTQYEKQHGVTLIRDKKLTFYVVKPGEGLGVIRNKLSKIPEFSYLSDSTYYVPSDGKRNIHGFNTPNSSLTPGFYLPIPLKKEEREISDSNFKNCARKALSQMEEDATYGKKMKTLLKNVNRDDVINIMTAYARSESSDDYTTFSFPIGSAEVHRREPGYRCYSFSYFHILMGRGPGMTARRNLGLSEGDCYDATNACKLFLGYCFEKNSDPTYFFNIKNLNDAKRVGRTYNGQRSYGNKLWANINHCKS